MYRKREIPLSMEICRILWNLPRRSEFVFCNAKGNVHNPRTWSGSHFGAFMKDMREYYADMGVDVPTVNPHQLRHTRLSLWVNSGVNIISVAKAGGQASPEMLRKHYVHTDVEELREQLGID